MGYFGAGVTPAEVESLIDARLAALNDISTADVDARLAAYDAPTKAEMDAAFAALNDISTADVDARLAAYDPPTKAEMDAAFAALNDVTAADVWNHATRTLSAFSFSVTVGVNNDKTGYSLTQVFPDNFSDLAITPTTGQVTVATNNDKTGYSISGTKTTLDDLNDPTADSVATAVWSAGTRTLTSFGSLVSSIWSHAGRTVSSIGTVTFQNVLAADGSTMTLIQGDTYEGADIQWTGDSADQWADLTDADILFGLEYGDTTFTTSGVVDVATGTQKFSVPISSAESGALPTTMVGKYDVQAYWAATDKYKTLVRGKVIVEKSYTPPPA